MAYNSAYTGPQVDGAVGSVIQNGEAWSGKQDSITGTQGQIVGFDNTGKPVAQNNTASGVTFSPGSTGMSADNVQAAVTELFTSVSDGKSAVAAAITDMGVTTAADATFQQMADNIGQIQTGPDTSDATATAGDILSGKTAYGASGKLTGTIPSQNAVTITPGTTQQTAIPAGTYAAGAATVEGDANLVPGNIAEGVSIFGVTGTFTGPQETVNLNIAIYSMVPFITYVALAYIDQNGALIVNADLLSSLSNFPSYTQFPVKKNSQVVLVTQSRSGGTMGSGVTEWSSSGEYIGKLDNNVYASSDFTAPSVYSFQATEDKYIRISG